MSSNAKWGKGSKLYKGGIAGTAVAELTNIAGVDLTSEEIDVTSHDSPDGFKEFIQGWKDGGEIPFEGNFIPGDPGQALLYAAYNSGEVDDYAIKFPDAMGTAWSFVAWVKSIKTGAPHNEKIPFSGALRSTGKPSLDITASGGLTGLTGIEEEAEGALVFLPTFNNSVYFYSVQVDTASTWIKLTPTAAAHTIKVNGNVVTSGAQSGEIALGAAGTNTLIRIEAKETNKIAKVYEVLITRAAE